jgi:hypothetical protein
MRVIVTKHERPRRPHLPLTRSLVATARRSFVNSDACRDDYRFSSMEAVAKFLAISR